MIEFLFPGEATRMTVRSAKSTARLAGVLYMLSGLPGIFSYQYLPGAFIVPGDSAATARNIAESTLTYRLGIAADLTGQIFLLFVVLTLYGLLKNVDKGYARLMVMLVAVGATFEIGNVLNLIAPLILQRGANSLSAFTRPQLDALALDSLQLRTSGLFIAQLFWGLWLLPFGVLVIKSGFFPKILGVLLIVSCFAYLTDSFVFLVFPAHTHPLTHFMKALGGLGEGATIIWLLVKGVSAPQATTAELRQ